MTKKEKQRIAKAKEQLQKVRSFLTVARNQAKPEAQEAFSNNIDIVYNVIYKLLRADN